MPPKWNCATTSRGQIFTLPTISMRPNRLVSYWKILNNGNYSRQRTISDKWMNEAVRGDQNQTRLQPASTQCVTTMPRARRLCHGAGGDVRASVAGWRCRCRVTVWLWWRWHLTTCACAGRYIKQHCRVTLRTIHRVIYSNSKLSFNWTREKHKWTKNHFNTPCHSQLATTSICPITIIHNSIKWADFIQIMDCFISITARQFSF